MSDSEPQSRLLLYSLESGESRQLSQAERNSGLPFWSPDSRSIAFFADGKLLRLDIAGGAPHTITETRGAATGTWNGETIVFSSNVLSRVAASGGTPVPLTAIDPSRREIGHYLPVFLPDGSRFLYLRVSSVTGNLEVWVQPYPGPGAAVRVSPNGGNDPVWAKNGRELFYLEGRKMMAVSFRAGSTFEFTRPVMLFTRQYLHPTGSPLTYDVAADGRFLMLKRVDTNTGPTPINVVLNWVAGLRR